MKKELKDNYLKVSTLFIVFVFLFFPIIHDFKPFYRELPPHGIPHSKPYFRISLENYINGKWQKRVTDRAKKNSGLWTPLLNVGNEIMLRVFSQIGIHQNGSVFLGKENYLIQDAHLAEFNNKKLYSSKLDEQLIKFKEIQDYQLKRGKSFLFLITPSLISLYPELLPEIYIDPTRDLRNSRYEILKKKLEDLGIYYIDSVDLLQKNKNNYPFRFFSNTASHWNDVASCLTLNEISIKLKNLKLPNIGILNCNNYKISDSPKPKDTDLLDMANLLFPSSLHRSAPYVENQETELINKPSILLVGTSYFIAIYKHIKDWNLYKELSYYFYFKQFKTPKSRSFHILRKDRLDWENIVDRDLIIVNIGVSDLNGIGSGFIEEFRSRIPN